MRLWEHYHTPRTIDDALKLLASYDGTARIIAGGTDLLIDLQAAANDNKLGDHRPRALIDVTKIAEMTAIRLDDGVFMVGAAVTHTAIVRAAELEAAATCLVESCGVVGGPQVRNVGTLGGNVAHALPAGDGTTSLVALDAEGLVAWADGRREWLPIANLYKGAGISALDSRRDVLVAFRFRACNTGEGCAFKRIMRPQGVALPVLGCAVWIALHDDGVTICAARVCIAPVSQMPTRARDAEAALIGQVANDVTVENVVTVAQASLKPRTSKYRATDEYRYGMIGTLLRGALPLAMQRAQTGIAHAEGVGA
ncbi:MAG: FAD binding domain-containing protein [Chloroflexota bacterium]|nr:FAD binding domain-containing protein [Chloroflexota bacterium]